MLDALTFLATGGAGIPGIIIAWAVGTIFTWFMFHLGQ